MDKYRRKRVGQMLMRVEIICEDCKQTVVEAEWEEDTEEDEVDPRAIVKKFSAEHTVPPECPECGCKKLNVLVLY